MAGSSYLESTETATVADLLDPECGILFEIHNKSGEMMGVFVGHKNLVALKSTFFKAILFGALRGDGDTIQIKDTSLGAFKTLLRHIQEDEKEDNGKKKEIDEVIMIADLAEKCHLPQLKAKTIDFARSFPIQNNKRLLETFSLAEELHVFSELSEALFQNCRDFLLTVIATPADYNDFIREHSEDIVAFRLLAQVDHGKMAFVDTRPNSVQLQQIVSSIRNIKMSIRPRHHLKELLKVLKGLDGWRGAESGLDWNNLDSSG